MFLSLNRKIIYTILSLFLISSISFISAFYMAYSSKVEKDQIYSIQRNQQYTDLLYRNILLIKELKQLAKEYQGIKIDNDLYPQIYSLIYDSQRPEFLVNEQKMIEERSKNFDAQYKTINNGITIIALSALILALFIIFIGYLIQRWILIPINKISSISEEISNGNLNIRIPLRSKATYIDELDRLSSTFNMMVDNLQNTLSEVRNKEKFLQSLIDSIPDGIRVIDQNYNIIIANKSYYKQVGHNPHKKYTCYRSAFKSKSPCNIEHIRCPLYEITQKNKKNVNTIQQFSHNAKRHLAINAAPLIYDNKHMYIVESIRDLSKDIDFSHQQKISSLGFLSSSIAHEIKNHLGALRLITEHTIDKYYNELPDDNEQKKMIKMIHSEIIETAKVPERLLKLMRNSTPNETLINCIECINDVINILDFEAKSKGINISFSSPSQNIYIHGNETDFKIAVINIILNALKAIQGDGKLSISIEDLPTGEIKINFTDTGHGISSTDLPYIFNPFFSEGRQTNDSRGSGLGLAITKSIIEKFGGKINVVSTLGKGSCFTFSFPPIKNLQKK